MEEKKRKYLTLRQICARMGNPTLYHRNRRKAINQYLSKRWGDAIINISNGVNYGLLIDEDRYLEILGGRQ